ncbi:MAG: carboxymuconolactone decarboxylase family protein [Planctomycetia bacterium]|nr:carboxymuconolactone decarboxylase family protein [Planctomycetia bacterium]MBL6915416.1 carboxymuconolactone decarboxylase family protein [Planctomycetota bacterium]MDC3251430.1 carboxymuconolactone decarboxylase family protein [Planctomycetota bacterium]HCW45613.1 peroxidase [Planctomycetota bacterium]
MSWITELNPNEDDSGILERVYSAASGRVGSVAQILKVMSLRPDLLELFMRFYVSLMKEGSGLSCAEKEWVAVLTSQVNDCHY